jgi:hypothetical protein
MKIWNVELKLSKYYRIGFVELIMIAVVLCVAVMWAMLVIDYFNTDWDAIYQ